MNLSAWLGYIESLHPSTIVLGLDRIAAVYQKLEIKYPPRAVITVGGTNGKGTTVAALESIYRAAKYHVGAYTSPHLMEFQERIRLDGHQAIDAALCAAFAAVQEARGDILLTYFEFTTLAAFWLFGQTPLAVWILEVGMGGRLDAVNLLDADVAIITNIALDHQEWLGQTREAIAWEKLGITRKDKPLIYGEDKPVDGFGEMLLKKEVSMYQVHQHFDYAQDNETNTWSWHNQKTRFEGLYKPPFILENVACAIAAIDCLQEKLPITPQDLDTGLRQMKWPGRCQTIAHRPWQFVDVAHNPHACLHLAKVLGEKPKKGRRIAIFSVLRDKDLDNMVAPLLQHIDAWYVAGLPGVSRGYDTATLAKKLREHKLTVVEFEDVAQAYRVARNQASDNDGIIIFGSFYTVAQVLQCFRSQSENLSVS